MSRRTLRCALFAGVLLLPGGCAKQGFPPGGPEDRTPPDIVSSEPESGSTSVGLRSPVVVTFSEPMQRDEVEKALNVFPATAGGLNLDWQGASLRISPDTAWDANRTYILILQAQARDLHNNRLARSLQIAFSTGPAIDSGIVSGRIVKAGRPAAGATALLFRVDSGIADPEKDTADYVLTADSSGRFEFGYLGAGAYRIFGLDDRDGDWLWNVGAEAIAVPTMDARLQRPGESVLLPPLLLAPLDTVMPVILNCTMTAPDMLQLDLSADLDSSWLDLQTVALESSGQVLPARQLYMLDSVASRIYAHFASPPEVGSWTAAVGFQHAGTGARSTDSCEVVVTGEPAGSAARRAPVLDPDSTRASLAWQPRAQLRFAEPVPAITAQTLACRSTDFGGVAECSLLTPFTVAVQLPMEASGKGPLELVVPNGFIEQNESGRWPPGESLWTAIAPFPPADSVGQFDIYFDSSDVSIYAGAEVGVRAVSGPRGFSWIGPLRGNPLAGELRGGDYLLFVLQDRDGNFRRDSGWPNPYRSSEPFWELRDTLRVRARFTTELTLPPLAKKQLP